MRNPAIYRVLAAVAGLALAVAGCCQEPHQRVRLDQLVAEHNANAALAPRLWARAKIEATVYSQSGLPFTWGSISPAATPNGFLILVKGAEAMGPHDFALIGQEAGMTIFQAGVSAGEDKYYFWFQAGDKGRGWWGRLATAGAPGVTDIPIDPTQLAAATNLCPLPGDLTKLPAVAMTMADKPQDFFYDSPAQALFGPCRLAYVVTYIDRQAGTGRIGPKRETYFLWSDREARRPFLIRYLDETGMPVMTARLNDYRQIESAAGPGALMPTDIRIDWLRTKARVHVVLSGATSDKGKPEACQPRFPDGIELLQVDKNVPASGGHR